jgi:hypothetical protein
VISISVSLCRGSEVAIQHSKIMRNGAKGLGSPAPSILDGRKASIDFPLDSSPALSASFQRGRRFRPDRGAPTRQWFYGQQSRN